MNIQIGLLHVRRSCFINASPGRVWKEFLSIEQLSAWFGRGQTVEKYEAFQGGEIVLSVDIDSVTRRFGGPILIFEAARELTFSNNWTTDGWPVPTFITLRLSSLFDGCQVELFHHGFERLGRIAGEQLQGYEAGWHSNHLEALKSIVES